MYCFVSYTNTLATRKSRVRSLLKKRTRSHSLLALNRASDVPAVHWPSQTCEKSSRSFTCGDTFFLNGGNPYKESTAVCITSEIRSNCGVLTSCEAERFKLSRILHLDIWELRNSGHIYGISTEWCSFAFRGVERWKHAVTAGKANEYRSSS